MDDTKIICPVCGETLTPTDEFCSNCGRRMFKKNKDKTAGEGSKLHWHLSNTSRAVVLFALSLILCVFSFLPLTKFVLANEDNLAYQGDVMDSYIYFVESFRTRTPENVKDTYAFEKLNEANDRLEDDDIWPQGTKPSRQARKIFDELIHYGFRTNLMLAENEMELTTVVSFVASAIYTIAAISFVLLSLFHLVNTFRHKRSLVRQCFYLLSAIPCLALLASFAMTNYAGFYCVSGRRVLGSGLILTLLTSLAALVFFALQRISVEKAERRMKLAVTVKHILVAIGAFALVLALVMPMISVKLKRDFAGDTYAKTVKRPFYAGYFAEYTFTEEEFSWYEENEKNESNAARVLAGKEKLESLLTYAETLSSDNVKIGVADMMIQNMTQLATAMSILRVQFLKGIVAIYVLAALLGLGASLLFCNSMSYLLLGYEKRKSVRITKITCIALSVLNLIAMISCVCMQNYFFRMVNLEYTIATRISVGNIVGIIFTLLLLSTCFIGVHAKQKRAESQTTDL